MPRVARLVCMFVALCSADFRLRPKAPHRERAIPTSLSLLSTISNFALFSRQYFTPPPDSINAMNCTTGFNHTLPAFGVGVGVAAFVTPTIHAGVFTSKCKYRKMTLAQKAAYKKDKRKALFQDYLRSVCGSWEALHRGLCFEYFTMEQRRRLRRTDSAEDLVHEEMGDGAYLDANTGRMSKRKMVDAATYKLYQVGLSFSVLVSLGSRDERRITLAEQQWAQITSFGSTRRYRTS